MGTNNVRKGSMAGMRKRQGPYSGADVSGLIAARLTGNSFVYVIQPAESGNIGTRKRF